MQVLEAQISPATSTDLPDVLALLRQSQLLETGVAEAITNFSLARAETQLVGCAGFEPYGDCGLLRSVAVDASARATGVGTRLVDSVAAAARARGLVHLFLLTTTAASFFERRGFRSFPRAEVPPPIARSWEFRVGCPQTAIAMRFELPKSATNWSGS
jgi:amino-acid N-acetyltransferase